MKFESFRFLPLVLFLISGQALADSEMQLAVVPFKNVVGDRGYDWLGQGFCEAVTTGLTQVKSFDLVERSLIDFVIAEQRLSNSDLFDPKTAAKLGQLSGANMVLIGSYQIMSGRILVNTRIVDVQTARVISLGAVSNLTEEYENLFDLYVKLVDLVGRDFDSNWSLNEEHTKTVEETILDRSGMKTLGKDITLYEDLGRMRQRAKDLPILTWVRQL